MRKVVLFIIIMIALFFIPNCESSTGISIKGIVGNWNLNNANVSLAITTNSDQDAVDLISPGIGGIEISGDIKATLKYLVSGSDYLYASEASPQNMDNYKSYVVVTFDSASVSLTNYNYENPALSEYYIGGEAQYTYDASTYTVTLRSKTLYKFDMSNYTVDSSAYVKVSGTLQNQIYSLKANVSQEITSEFFDNIYNDNTEFEVNEDGTYSIVSIDEGETITTTGTWEEADGQILFHEKDDETEHIINYSGVYENDGNDLLLFIDMDYCNGFWGYQENSSDCYYLLEELLNIENGSVADATISIEMNLTSK